MTEKPHTVKSYEEQLQQLTNNLVIMGGNCETALGNSIKALCNNDNTIADTAINKCADIIYFSPLTIGCEPLGLSPSK